MRHPGLKLFLLLSLVVFLHAGALKNEFYWDDRPLIMHGYLVKSWASVPAIFGHELWYNVDLGERAPTARIDTYRPLSNFSFLVDYKVWGGHPAGFHFTNLLIHLFSTVLVFLLFARVGPGVWSWVGTALFALHPLCTECIHYVSARTDSLAVLFVLGAAWFGFRRFPLSRGQVLGMAISFLLGAFVKETALVFLPFFIVFSWARSRSFFRQDRFALCMLSAALLGYVLLRLNALGRMKAIYDAAHLVEILLNYPAWMVQFLRTALIPIQNMPMQHFEMIRPPGSFLSWLISIVFFILLGFFLVQGFRRKSLGGLFLGWMLLCLLPPFFASSLTEVTNPRYLYGAYIGLAGFLAWSLSHLHVRKWLWSLCVGLVLVGLSLQTLQTAPQYRTGQRFYRAILRDHPTHVEAMYNLANTLHRDGRKVEAVSWYQMVLRYEPGNASAWNNLGLTLLDREETGAALSAFRRAVGLQPKEARYHYHLALALEKNNEVQKSADALERSLEKDSKYRPSQMKAADLCERFSILSSHSLCRNKP